MFTIVFWLKSAASPLNNPAVSLQSKWRGDSRRAPIVGSGGAALYLKSKPLLLVGLFFPVLFEVLFMKLNVWIFHDLF